MDARRTRLSTIVESQTRSGTVYSVLSCSNFSLAAAVQAAVAEECSNEDEVAEEAHGGKRDRAYESSDSEDDDARNTSQSVVGSGGEVKRPRLAPQIPSTSSGQNPDAAGEYAQAKTRSEHRKDRKKLKRKAKKLSAFHANTNQPSPEVVAHYVASAETASARIDTTKLPVNSSGYEALFTGAKGDDVLNLEELLGDGYDLAEWNGDRTLLFTDSDSKKVFAVCVAKPTGPNLVSYEASCDAVADLLLELGLNGGFTQEDIDENVRGPDFVAINFGMGAGHGPPEPYNLRNDKHRDVVNSLLASPHLERLALHQSASFQFYFPNLYNYYHEHTIPVRDHHDHLVPNWTRSIFTTAACNLGPQTATFFHRDGRNLSFGMCGIHSAGKYDYKKGGHLVLKEAKLIIEFPPGCLIFIPSAVITHGNTPVQAGETRFSFTQYSSGAFFRYFDNGFRTEAKLKKRDKKRYREVLKEKETRWEMGLGLWCTVDELLAQGGLKTEGSMGEGPLATQ